MSNPAMWNAIRRAVVASLLSIAASTASASAASLFYFKGETRAPNERVCLRFALDQASRHNLQNIKHDNLGVGGTKGNFFVVMTCVGKVVVVVVAGDSGEDGRPLAQELFDAVKGEVCIDACN